MDTQRLILLFIFGFSVLMLWEAWEKENRPKPVATAPAVATQQGIPAPAAPAASTGAAPAAKAPVSAVPAADTAAKGETVRVTTDLLVADVDTIGGTLKRVELTRHKDSKDWSKNLVLLGPEHRYEAQSGLTGDSGPNHRTAWRVLPGERSLAAGQDAVELRLAAPGKDGLEVQKVYTFRRDSYVIDIALEIRNPGATPISTYGYFQLTHDGRPETSTNSVAATFGAQSFTGFGVYSTEHAYEKVHLSDLDKGKADHVKRAANGWLAIIAWPLFWLLEKFHALSGNWGVAIILLTVLIKIIFFPLSAASYKSMAKMKLVTPRLTKIREMYGHDRQKMNQAMMELYKTEKINPLGGCFPILVQIPVFIALYWTLLAAIELRHAPFMLWINDLSALDPYYVLPILMTITMVVQTKLNPVPPDPVQAQVMKFMPYVFSIFFFFFPAGLVLYWLVNNILSILQQWQIQRMFDRDKPAHGKR